jgi:hypothetical protein
MIATQKKKILANQDRMGSTNPRQSKEEEDEVNSRRWGKGRTHRSKEKRIRMERWSEGGSGARTKAARRGSARDAPGWGGPATASLFVWMGRSSDGARLAWTAARTGERRPAGLTRWKRRTRTSLAGWAPKRPRILAWGQIVAQTGPPNIVTQAHSWSRVDQKNWAEPRRPPTSGPARARPTAPRPRPTTVSYSSTPLRPPTKPPPSSRARAGVNATASAPYPLPCQVCLHISLPFQIGDTVLWILLFPCQRFPNWGMIVAFSLCAALLFRMSRIVVPCIS